MCTRLEIALDHAAKNLARAVVHFLQKLSGVGHDYHVGIRARQLKETSSRRQSGLKRMGGAIITRGINKR
jgi:hypothetical protein